MADRAPARLRPASPSPFVGRPRAAMSAPSPAHAGPLPAGAEHGGHGHSFDAVSVYTPPRMGPPVAPGSRVPPPVESGAPAGRARILTAPARPPSSSSDFPHPSAFAGSPVMEHTPRVPGGVKRKLGDSSSSPPPAGPPPKRIRFTMPRPPGAATGLPPVSTRPSASALPAPAVVGLSAPSISRPTRRTVARRRGPPASGSDSDYVEKAKAASLPAHEKFAPREPRTDHVRNHKVHSYKGYEYGPRGDEVDFEATMASSDEDMPRVARAWNTSNKHQAGLEGRGRLHDSPHFLKNHGLNRAHVIADRFKGSGHGLKRGIRGHNTVTTSAAFNQLDMARQENRISDWAGRRRFDLEAGIDYYSDFFNEDIKKEMRGAGAIDPGYGSDSLGRDMAALTRKAPRLRRIRNVTYTAGRGSGPTRETQVFRTGPDLHAGVTREQIQHQDRQRDEAGQGGHPCQEVGKKI